MTETNANWGAPEPPQESMNHDDLAGFWIRFVAHVCDQVNSLVIVIPIGLVGRALGLNDVGVLVVGSLAGAWLLAHWTVRRGGSPLRARLGVLVLDESDGSFLDMNRSLKRAMFPTVLGIFANLFWVLAIVLLMDYLVAVRNPRKQTWHDRFAGSVVVRR